MSREAALPVACSRLFCPAGAGASPLDFATGGLPLATCFSVLVGFTPDFPFAADFVGFWDFLVAFASFVSLTVDVGVPLARGARLALGLALLSVIVRPFRQIPLKPRWSSPNHSAHDIPSRMRPSCLRGLGVRHLQFRQSEFPNRN